MKQSLEAIALKLATKGKGILAADEGPATIKKRFDSIGVESTEEQRRNYREMLFSDREAMTNYISGVILYDETIRQKASSGLSFVEMIQQAGSIPGIKVDLGAKALAAFPGEFITEGLDGLDERLQEYYALGARFAKWRSVIAINKISLPTRGAIRQNAVTLARYAALCQQAGIVPIVEPEVLMDGVDSDHSIDRCYDVTYQVLNEVFLALKEANILLEGMILKPNMVIDGKGARAASVEEVAAKTLHCLKATVPASVPAIAFLSGGQSEEEATAHLAAMNEMGSCPWVLTFSYGRALQSEALDAWRGKQENVAIAQKLFTNRARLNSLAAVGKSSIVKES